MLIPEKDIQYSQYSLMDTFGKVFFWDNRVFRGVTDENALKKYNQLNECGLLSTLIEEQLFPETIKTEFFTEKYFIVLEHSKIHPQSFIYEWSFDMVKAAGFCILNVNKIASKFGYVTIDAHPYNVLFKGCQALFLDLGSFIENKKDKEWNAEKEFNGFYNYPLKIWNKVGYAMARRIYSDLSCLSYEEYNLLKMISLPNFINTIPLIYKRVILKLCRVLHLKKKTDFLKIEKRLTDIKYKTKKSIWSNYHESYLKDNAIDSSPRFDYIIQRTKELGIASATELAGNWGLFSYLLLKRTNVQNIICTDYDEIAVNRMFHFFKNSEYKQSLSPVLIDFMRPVELYISGKPSKRFKSESVYALAVTHHLIIGQGYNIESIFQKIGEYTSKFIFIEFMPLGLWDGNNSTPVPTWYNQKWFKEKFELFYELIEIKELEKNRILFIGTIK